MLKADQQNEISSSTGSHRHRHALNRFAVIPIPERFPSEYSFTGRGVTIAIIDSGFYCHPDLTEPENRIVAYQDVTGEEPLMPSESAPEVWHWHGTMVSVVAAGNGHLSDGRYSSLAPDAKLVLVKASKGGQVSEENIAKAIDWVVDNRERLGIQILSISLGGDKDVPCSSNGVDLAAERAVSAGIVVIAASGNSSNSTSVPPANAPSVLTVGGFDDGNSLNGNVSLYHSSYGQTADGIVKPELIAPAMWVPAPILPCTAIYLMAEKISLLVNLPVYALRSAADDLLDEEEHLLFKTEGNDEELRDRLEDFLIGEGIVATHYKAVEGTSFAAPIVASIAARMLEANPGLTPLAVRNILISTAMRVADQSVVRQGFGIVAPDQAIKIALRDHHSFAADTFHPPRAVGGLVRFVYHDDTAQSVGLAGDFNSWDAKRHSLRRGVDGLWSIELPGVAAGAHKYRFVVDGARWVEDPNNGYREENGYGGMNSIFVIS